MTAKAAIGSNIRRRERCRGWHQLKESRRVSNNEQLPLDQTGQHVKMFSDLYFGNGKPGLTTRMQQVEDTIEAQKWYFRAIILILLGLLAKALWPVSH